MYFYSTGEFEILPLNMNNEALETRPCLHGYTKFMCKYLIVKLSVFHICSSIFTIKRLSP